MKGDFWLAVLLVTAIAMTALGAYKAGWVEGRQSVPSICEPKCEFIYRNGKLINVTCPDSTGVTRGR
jgi:hypothetical protein